MTPPKTTLAPFMGTPSPKQKPISFVKMEGLGNDFIVLDEKNLLSPLTPDHIRALSNRRYGIGCDQIMVLGRPTGKADVKVTIYNADGSMATACGNGMRCVAELMKEDHLAIETPSGIVEAFRTDEDHITVDMGQPLLKWQEIPLAELHNTLEIDLKIPGFAPGTAINMGNPHIVFFVEDLESVNLEMWGPRIENHPLFPKGVNVEFAQPIKDKSREKKFRVKVWERGVGITPACGTGACAVAVAAVRQKIIAMTPVEIILDGGSLNIDWRRDNHVVQTGPARICYTGSFPLFDE